MGTGLLNLPDELICCIIEHIDARDLRWRIAVVCRRLAALAHGELERRLQFQKGIALRWSNLQQLIGRGAWECRFDNWGVIHLDPWTFLADMSFEGDVLTYKQRLPHDAGPEARGPVRIPVGRISQEGKELSRLINWCEWDSDAFVCQCSQGRPSAVDFGHKWTCIAYLPPVRSPWPASESTWAHCKAVLECIRELAAVIGDNLDATDEGRWVIRRILQDSDQGLGQETGQKWQLDISYKAYGAYPGLDCSCELELERCPLCEEGERVFAACKPCIDRVEEMLGMTVGWIPDFRPVLLNTPASFLKMYICQWLEGTVVDSLDTDMRNYRWISRLCKYIPRKSTGGQAPRRQQ